MHVQLVEANPLVEEVRNQVAVKRGPIVYCLESVDLPKGIEVTEVMIPQNVELKPKYNDYYLRGAAVLEGEAFAVKEGDWTDKLYREFKPKNLQSIPIKLIPYYAWSNRGISHMTVWMPIDR